MFSAPHSFSVAKSLTSLAIGVAIDQELIESHETPVGTILPEFQDGLNMSLNVEHLLSMSSGIDFGESYSNPFGYMAKAYYGDDLEGLTLRYDVTREPGELWVYEGGNTVLLGSIIEEVTQQTISEYFSEQIWKKI